MFMPSGDFHYWADFIRRELYDLMYYNEEGVYFLIAKGKAFYEQLMEQN